MQLNLPDVQLTLTTDRGVFAKGGIDSGTKFLLLDGPEATEGDLHLADFGAGYGPIALTLASRNPDATIWAIEINQRARDLCRHNAETLGFTNVKVVDPEAEPDAVDSLPDHIQFDRIWSNPPIRIGKQPLQRLLTRWLARLKPGGTGHLVVQKHLGSDSLHRWLDTEGWPTERRSSRAGFRILDVAAPSAQATETPTSTDHR